MKILITTEWYKPVINGVVTSVLNLKKGLEEDGHEVRVLTLAKTKHSYKMDNVYYMASAGVGKIYPNARVTVPICNDLIKDIIDWNPDIIHSQCEFSTFVYASRISKATGAPIVHTYHTVYEGYTHYFCHNKVLGKKLVRSFTRKIADHSDTFIVPSSKIKDMLEGYRISAPMHVIPSGIEVEKYIGEQNDERNILRRELGIDENECVLVFVGRLAKEKNIEEIMNFMTDEKLQNIKLLIVGDGPYRNNLIKACNRLNLNDRVIFTGMIPSDKVKNYYQAGDIFVSGSTSETQGLTYMEAMASGLPLVCRNDKCLDDVIDNNMNGYVYNNRDEFICDINKLQIDVDLRETIGGNAEETVVSKYSVSAFAHACEDVYDEMIAK